MDEEGLRIMFKRLADTEAPPTTVHLGRAIDKGRSIRRRRRLLAGSSTLTMSAVAGAVVALLVVPATHATGGGPATGPTASRTSASVLPAVSHSPDTSPAPVTSRAPGKPAIAPRQQFSMLVPYASFGWLPAGYVLAAKMTPYETSSRDQLYLTAWSGNSGYGLYANAAGSCSYTGARLSCAGSNLQLPVEETAPTVNGRPAVWLQSGYLGWEYAPDSWALLNWPQQGSSSVPGPSEEAAVMRIASTVQFGDTTPVEFPYTMAGLGAGWTLSSAEFTQRASRMLVVVMNWRNGGTLLQIVVMPETPGDECPAVTGTARHVTLDGASAILEGAGSAMASVCAADVRGWTVSVSLQPGTGASTAGGGVLGYARALRLLTAEPADWTTTSPS
jgi:hypothetical protein